MHGGDIDVAFVAVGVVYPEMMIVEHQSDVGIHVPIHAERDHIHLTGSVRVSGSFQRRSEDLGVIVK